MLWNSCCENVDLIINPVSESGPLSKSFKTTIGQRAFLSYASRSGIITVTTLVISNNIKISRSALNLMLRSVF